MLALGGGLRGAPVVITFETLAPGAAVESQFSGRGITFSNARCVDYGLQIGQPDGFAHSGRKGIEPCFAQEFCSVPLDMTFALEQRYVKVWVGYANRSTFNLDIQLRGDFGTGSRVAMATLPPSDAPTPIRTPLQVVAPRGSRGFVRAQLSATIDGQPASYFAVDDVEFDTMEEPACAPLLGTGGGVVVQDMNGDGVFDPITEAIQLLSWAFLGASAPVAPCCAGGGPSGLPDTGQTKCYDASGAEISCDSATCPGQDGFYATGCSLEGRFTDNGDGTVTDHCTGLQWQKDTADTNGDGQLNGGDFIQWCDALAYCENLSFAGHDDWRLPNVRELQSILDYGRSLPAIDPVFRARSDVHSSSTSRVDPADSKWYVIFERGQVGTECKELPDFVRAVRSRP